MKIRILFAVLMTVVLIFVNIPTNSNSCSDSCRTHFGGHNVCIQYSFLCDPGTGVEKLYVVSSCLPPFKDDPTIYEACIPWY